MKVTGFVLFLLLLSGLVFGQAITTVGVIDTARVYSTFFSQSAGVREIENFRAEFQADLNRHAQELRELQNRKLDADRRGDESASLQLDNQIFQKAQFIQDFQRIRQRQLEQLQSNLSQSDSFLRELQTAIRLTSESAGFTVVLDARNNALQWWSPEVDITDRVIARLRGR
jgi:outer membrane protein